MDTRLTVVARLVGRRRLEFGLDLVQRARDVDAGDGHAEDGEDEGDEQHGERV